MNIALTTDKFINRCNDIHDNRYDYSLVDYNIGTDKIIIICKKHGEFLQTAKEHLKGSGCKKCYLNKISENKQSFIKKSILVHGYKYDYTDVEYITSNTKVNIRCDAHGHFMQTPGNHKAGHGCPSCVGLNRRSNIDFIKESILKHGDRYDYTNTNYINTKTKVNIICKKHGEFLQSPRLHLEGKGCPTCKCSKGEIKIINYLENNKVYFIKQKKFNDCKNINNLRFDFYLPKYNLCIEYNGKQHYEPVSIFGGIDGFNIQSLRDNIKIEYCAKNNIKLLIIKYNENIIDILNEYLKLKKSNL